MSLQSISGFVTDDLWAPWVRSPWASKYVTDFSPCACCIEILRKGNNTLGYMVSFTAFWVMHGFCAESPWAKSILKAPAYCTKIVHCRFFFFFFFKICITLSGTSSSFEDWTRCIEDGGHLRYLGSEPM